MTTKNNLAGATTVETLPNGVIVYQVTNEPVIVDNIYCGRSYCTPDSRWFVFQR